MPRAQRSQEGKRFDLKTAPPDGYVVLLRMSFSEYLQRQEMSGIMSVSAKTKKDIAGTIAMAQQKVTAFEFARCVTEHNLTDDNDQSYDFSGMAWMGPKGLDPKIANEIAEYIDDLHQFTEDDTLPKE